MLKPKQIIELGTGYGGLAVFLGLYAKGRCEFHTFSDRPDLFVPYWDLLTFLQVDIVTCNIFYESIIQAIEDLIKQPGATLLFCDNGNKIREFNLFAPMLKTGDVILVHDYYISKPAFDLNFSNSGCCEVVHADIQDVCRIENLHGILEDYLLDFLLYAAQKRK